jgi:1-phosphofructokinase
MMATVLPRAPPLWIHHGDAGHFSRRASRPAGVPPRLAADDRENLPTMHSLVVTVTLNPAIDQTVLLDALVPGAVHCAQVPLLAPQAGGKGINVAQVLSVLGVPAAAAGWLGADNAGVFEAAFARHGIVDDMVRVAGSTRCNLKLTDLRRGETTEVNGPGIALDPAAGDRAEADLLARLDARLVPGARVVLAGSLPPGAGAATWWRVAAFLAGRGAPVVVDLDAVALGALLAGLPMPSLPVLAKPNREELQALAGRPLGGPAEVADAARALLCERGVPRVLASLGAEGAVVVGPEGRWFAPAPEVASVAGTSGAGDALLAGTLAAWGEDGLTSFPEAVRFGMACAAWRIRQPGFTPAPSWEALHREALRIGLRPL